MAKLCNDCTHKRWSQSLQRQAPPCGQFSEAPTLTAAREECRGEKWEGVLPEHTSAA